jgi:hypothetical protein
MGLRVGLLAVGLLAEDAALAWITNAANAVTEYSGRFPLRHPRVMVRISEGREGSREFPWGNATTGKQLDDDWMMTHELIHMAFPI